MKKNKLEVEYDYDFMLLGLSCQAKEYRLAWNINMQLGISLTKVNDIHLEFKDDLTLYFSNLSFETENSCLKLIKNRAVESSKMGNYFLLPELKELDYLVYLQGEEDFFSSANVFSNLRSLSIIQFITKVEVETLKSKDNLIF
jgi:hypothetical protein